MSRVQTKKRKKEDILTIGGKELGEMFDAARLWLDKNAADIDAINVFPVPDGDCGKNMLLTISSAIENIDGNKKKTASSVMEKIAQGALMGARGNSGFLLSQFLEGMHSSTADKDSIGVDDMAEAISEGAKKARAALSEPKEGTILTVADGAAKGAKKAIKGGAESLPVLMEYIVHEAEKSLNRTPMLLTQLKEAGVVDAGGEGLLVIFTGMKGYLEGKVRPRRIRPVSKREYEAITRAGRAEMSDTYCTQLMIDKPVISANEVRKRLLKEGSSVIVAESDSKLRIHIHTDYPDKIADYAREWGNVKQFRSENMKEQLKYSIYPEGTKGKNIAVIAIAQGKGMHKLFRKLGAIATVSGGQTMNPSVRELREAVEAVPQKKVILLTNNKNVILTASRIGDLTDKELAVLPTKTMPQGISALVAFNTNEDIEQNKSYMQEVADSVITIQVTSAVRDTRVQNIPVKEGQLIALRDDEELLVADRDIKRVVLDALSKIELDKIEIITVYYGSSTDKKEAGRLLETIKGKYPEKDYELVDGHQPHYSYLVSLE